MKFVRWFEAMGGRYLPFYLLSPLTDFVAVSFDASHVTVKANFLANDWNFFPAIGVLMIDGTFQIRLITGTSQSGANWILTVDAWTTTPTLNTIRRLSAAHLVRFDTDEMVEEWITDGVMQINQTLLNFVELLDEKSLTIANIKDLTGGY